MHYLLTCCVENNCDRAQPALERCQLRMTGYYIAFCGATGKLQPGAYVMSVCSFNCTLVAVSLQPKTHVLTLNPFLSSTVWKPALCLTFSGSEDSIHDKVHVRQPCWWSACLCVTYIVRTPCNAGRGSSTSPSANEFIVRV